ncbi:UDP-glucuronosyltransferase [Paenibacillus campi]|uniref:UDP-glucuronosyltransferase n=1 Tax=Paenibacillus campi TaxID=3106031 RepID=UPI002AFF462B|nr:UDP-glucuronosyltransferase [Paenibacillus sp. SGZ-1009]
MTVTILCSGFGLGFYTPGLLVEASLKRHGLTTEVLVFENVMQDAQRSRVDHSRREYHHNFSVALMSQRIPQDIRKSMDAGQVDELLQRWQAEGRRHFICLSGHWVYVLELYREQLGEPLEVDLLYLDVMDSPSWKNVKRRIDALGERYREVWLFGDGEQPMSTYIDIAGSDPVQPYDQRDQRLLVHGGGWGMGTYREHLDGLHGAGYALNIVLYEGDAPGSTEQGQRYYRMDPDWRTWQQNDEGKHTFPPFARVIQGEPERYEIHPDYHKLCELERSVKAIVSKPGGGTLADSFASGTPVIFLDPFGEHEQRNAELWEQYGYGITYARWMSDYGGGTDILEQLHHNLLAARQQLTPYPQRYVAMYRAAIEQTAGEAGL